MATQPAATKQDKKTGRITNDVESTKPTRISERLDDVEPPPFRNEYEARAWAADRQDQQDKRSAAFRAFPPGSELYVTLAQGHPTKTRARAGLIFNAEHRAKVSVVDLPNADRVAKNRAGAYLVDPMGAALIVADASLHVFSAPDAAGDVALAGHLTAAEERIAELEAALAAKGLALPPRAAAQPKGLAAEGLREQALGKVAAPGQSSDFGGTPEPTK